MEPDPTFGLSLAERVHPKYRPAFDKLPEQHRAALALYFLPHGSKKDLLEVTRPRVVKWYCPFADQRQFPSGHRYCINVYTGCEHRCAYCYAAGYVAAEPQCKNNFRADLAKDLDALDEYDVPAAPVHVSNSTDALQSLEREHRHTLFTLEKIAQRRHRFTTVTLLTKNPAALTEEPYVEVLERLNSLPDNHPQAAHFKAKRHPPLRIECSLAFFDDRHRQLLDPAAPDVESRLAAIRFLRQRNIPIAVRIDPLFPRDPLLDGRAMTDFDLPDVQSLPDLDALIQFCRENGVMYVVYSPAKITLPRHGKLPPIMEKMKRVYEHLSPAEPLPFRGGAWRLADDVAAKHVLGPFLDICKRHGVEARSCKANLLSTP